MISCFKVVSRLNGLKSLRKNLNFSTNSQFKLLNSLQTNEKKTESEGKKKEPEPDNRWDQKASAQGVLKLKDLFDYIVYGTFGVFIYYAYQNYDQLKQFKKDINAQLVEVTDFKHKFYSIQDYIIPEFILNKLQDLKAFEVRKDDVWVASFPKSGTTWVQELVYLIQSDCDFETAKTKTIEERSPFFEYPSPGLNVIKKMKSPRIIKTHMPIELLPDDIEKNSKIVYILRNPKDVTISFFYFIRMSTESGYKGGIADFIDLFKEGKVPYGPWWKHVDGFTSRKNVHVIHYEDLHKRPKETLSALCKFLDKDVDDSKLESIEKWCQFDNMKNNPMVNYEWNKVMGLYRKEGEFFRKGKIGDWLRHFTLSQSKEYDIAIEKNLKYDADLDYGVSKTDLDKIYAESNKNKA